MLKYIKQHTHRAVLLSVPLSANYFLWF